jgi:aryl-alcohol dehydrogenase-like predicted oxidoreductase
VPAARDVGAGFVPYSPLGRGFLTGTLTPERISAGMLRSEPRFVEHFENNQKVVDLIRAVGDEVSATPAQVALGWLYAQGEALRLPVVPIPGTRSRQRVTENAGAVHVRLSPEQKARLDAAAELAHGDRNLTFTSKNWISADRD